MKKITIILSLILLFYFAEAQKNNGFRINANIKGLKNVMVRVKVNDKNGNLYTIDSTNSKGGNFFLKGKINNSDIAFLEFETYSQKLTFFIDNSDLQMTGSEDSIAYIHVTGSKVQYEYERVMKDMKVFADLQNECKTKYDEAQNSNDFRMMHLYDSISNSVFEHQINYLVNYALKNGNSIVAPYMVLTNLIYYVELNTLDSITKSLDKSLYSTYFGNTLITRVETLKKVDIGKTAPNIVLPDTDGKLLSLSSLKGKYVLIDFWASWCSPCRKENPNVVNAYNLYKDKGFDILGVSMDQNRNNWLKAIKDDNLTWHHVSDLKGWANEAGKLYGVNSIPHSVLIDKNGIIIAKNLRGEELLSKLSTLLGK